MKKTSFTFAKTFRRQPLANTIRMVFTMVGLLLGNFAFGQFMDACPAGSGNVTASCPGVGPDTVYTDGSCQVLVPDYKPGVNGTAGADYSFMGGLQYPLAGSVLTGEGDYTVAVVASFLNLGPAFGGTADPDDGTLCEVACSSVTLRALDNIPPVVACATPITIDVDTLTCSAIFSSGADALQFVPTLSDNCTATDSIALTIDVNNDMTVEAYPVSLTGPTCPGPNSVTYNLRIIGTDASGNSASCVANVTVRDNTPPKATCPGDQIVPINSSFGICNISTPDFTSLVTGISDNCGTGTLVQSPVPGTILGLSDRCDTLFQPTTIAVNDCFGNPTLCNFQMILVDTTAPQVTSNCSALGAVVNLIADSNCDILVPDLTSLMAAQDNCSSTGSSSLTISQYPVGAFNVFDRCPADTLVDISFIPTDCWGNEGDTVTCAAAVTFRDTIAPTVVCPADPIDLVLPFDPTTCEHGTGVVDVALAIAEGVVITDNCQSAGSVANVLPNMFMCADMGKAGLNVTIVGLDCFGNTDTAICSVSVIPDTDMVAAWNIGTDYIVCPSEFPLTINLGPNTPGCGTWSGDVLVSGIMYGPYTINAADVPDTDGDGQPGPGNFSVTYTVGSPSCHVSETHNIMVAPTFVAGDADLVADFSVCWEGTETFDLEALLLSSSEPGGAFSVSLGGSVQGNQVGNLFQYLRGDGTLTVTYDLTDCDGNLVSDQVVISIDEKPDGHFTLPASICQDGGVQLPVVTDVPVGATVTFASSPAGFITNAATGSFNPAAGALSGESVNVLVTMTVSNGVCANHINSQLVVVSASGNPAFTVPATICESDPILGLSLVSALNGNGVNGLTAANVTWTGTSVTDDGTTASFDPSVGPGTYTICVTVGAPTCEETECHDIVVQPDYTAAEVALADDFQLCIFPDEVIDLYSLLSATALPGGTFSVVEGGDLIGIGVINPTSYLYKGECGTITVTYSFPDDCVPSSDAITITIEEKPDLGGLDLSGPLCAQDGSFTLNYSGTPAVCNGFGVFSAPSSPAGTLADGGNGATATFDPVAAGEGTHTIVYEIGNAASGCFASISGEIEVRASSDADFSVPSTACANETIALALDNADPSVLPTSPDGQAEVVWFGGDGLHAVVTDNGDGTGSFVGYSAGTYTVCVQTGDLGCFNFTCHQITVDNVPPVLSCGPLVRARSTDAGTCSYTSGGVEFDVTATDNCVPPNGASSLVLTHNYAPHLGTNANSLDGAVFPTGITQIVWTATDTAGNAASCTIQIEVTDDEAPTVQSCPSNIAQGTDADICGAEVTYALPQFADNCDGTDLEGVMVSGLTSGSDFPVGVTTVTWEYS
ncbi:MAG: hypothetical protein RLY31_1447, partial [Bacteroidota bacterium]